MRTTTVPIEITDAAPEDEGAIVTLLRAADLPVEEAGIPLGDFLVARCGARIVGTVGLEAHGRAAFLRSLAVEAASRGQGLADRLVDRALARAAERGADSVWLLTTAAAAYFARWGFGEVQRGAAPARLRDHAQFRGLCPSTATCKRRELAATARSYPRGALSLRPDVPGARCFGVALERAELTYFEIDPGARFERHAHAVDQITLVLVGELRFELDDRPPVRLGPGEAIALPAGAPHAVIAGDEPVRAVDARSRTAERSRAAARQSEPAAHAEPLAEPRERWFDRAFPETLPVDRLPAILERMRGTAARLEEAVRGVPCGLLTRRIGDRWTAQEHVGHLGDLERLWSDRLDDFEAGRATLCAADLENRATTEARHDERDVAELLRRFRDARMRIVARLETWDAARLARRALHPRLKRPMSAVELAHFVAEHDDHHLAAIRALLREPQSIRT